MKKWIYVLSILVVSAFIFSGYQWMNYKTLQTNQNNALGQTLENVHGQLSQVQHLNEYFLSENQYNITSNTTGEVLTLERFMAPLVYLDSSNSEDWNSIKLAITTASQHYDDTFTDNNRLIEQQKEFLEDVNELIASIQKSLPDDITIHSDTQYFKSISNINEIDRSLIKQAATEAISFNQKWE